MLIIGYLMLNWKFDWPAALMMQWLCNANAEAATDAGQNAERPESDSAALELDSSLLADLRDAKQLLDRKERYDEHRECVWLK